VICFLARSFRSKVCNSFVNTGGGADVVVGGGVVVVVVLVVVGGGGDGVGFLVVLFNILCTQSAVDNFVLNLFCLVLYFLPILFGSIFDITLVAFLAFLFFLLEAFGAFFVV